MQWIGVKIDNVIERAESIHAATGGMPNLVQDLCRCLLESESVRKSRVVTVIDVQTALKSPAFVEGIDLQFRQITESLPRYIAFLMSDRNDFGYPLVQRRESKITTFP